VLRGVKEKHPKTQGTGEFGKFLLLLGRKLVNQSASTFGGESGVPKVFGAICMLESGPNASMKSEELKPAPVKVPTVGRIWISQEFRRGCSSIQRFQYAAGFHAQ
jgi:hypothetical protein